MEVTFVYNPTSWNHDTGEPWPGGMADALVQPVLAHMTPDEYRVARWPAADTVNVYYTHRSTQGVKAEPGPCSVFVSHGIADKAWRNSDRVRHRWDWVFVSGPAWTIKLINQGLDPDRIVEVGYAKLDPLFDGVRVERSDRVRVLWAPTHGGGGERTSDHRRRRRNRTSHHHAAELLELLPPDRYDVRVAQHPRHRPDKRATLDEYRDCDVVIADGGSTIYEAWALDLPVVFPHWLTGDANKLRPAHMWTFEAELYTERIGYHAMRPDAFAGQVEAAAARGITSEEREFVEAILPAEYRGQSGRLHAEALRQIAAGEIPSRVAQPLQPIRYRSRQGFEFEVMPGTDQQMLFERSARWRRIEEVTA